MSIKLIPERDKFYKFLAVGSEDLVQRDKRSNVQGTAREAGETVVAQRGSAG